jgi:hypothetical protein
MLVEGGAETLRAHRELPQIAGCEQVHRDMGVTLTAPMSNDQSQRISTQQAAAFFGRTTRWLRQQLARLSDSRRASLLAGIAGPRHETQYDRAALLAAIKDLRAAPEQITENRSRFLADHVGVRRRRDEEGAALCERPRCARPVEGRRRLCDLHTTARARRDRLQRNGRTGRR